MVTSQVFRIAARSSLAGNVAAPLLPDFNIAYGRQQKQHEKMEQEEEEENECVITHIVHGSDPVCSFAQESEANFLLRQDLKQEQEEEECGVGFPQTFLVLQDLEEKNVAGVVVEEEEEEACVYMVVDYGLQEVEEDFVGFPELQNHLGSTQQEYSEEEQEMASVVLDQGRWLLQPNGGARFEEVADLKPFLQAYMAANCVGLYAGVEEDVHCNPPLTIDNAADASQECSAMELEEIVNPYEQLVIPDGNAIGFHEDEAQRQEGDHVEVASQEEDEDVFMSVVEQPITSLSVFHGIVGTTLALQENSQQIALSVTPLSTRPPSSSTSLEVLEVGKELALRPSEHALANPCLLTPSAMFTGWGNFERITGSQPLKQITDGRSGEDYEWGHFDASDWVPFSSNQGKNSPPLLCGKKGSTPPYNCKPLRSRTPAQLVNEGRETCKDLSQSVEQSDAARQNVIQALYKFEELRQSFIEVEEARAAKGKAEGQAVRLRPDLRASVQMRIDGLRVNTNSTIGSVPGVHVGDHFWYRIEMVIVGLHQQLEAGIAFIGKSKSGSGISFATSIVIKHSGNPYLDDEENGDIITYTGQGGLSHRSPTAHSVADQVLTRGNEALKNSFEHSQPIRVIRGHKDKKSPTTESYTYLGLYKALAMRYEPGVGGNLVYKFDLQRLKGQPVLPAAKSRSHESPSIKAGPSAFKGKNSPSLESQSHNSASPKTGPSSFKGKNSASFKGKGSNLQSRGNGESSKCMSPKGKS